MFKLLTRPLLERVPTRSLLEWVTKKSSKCDKENKKHSWDGQLVHKLKLPKLKAEENALHEGCFEQPRVIIVGAGLAGLSVAQRLACGGISNFLIAEASGRVGGRINSTWSGEAVNELGAEWISGDWNPVLRLANLEDLSYCSPVSPVVYLASDGRPIADVTVSKALRLFENVKCQAEAVFGMESPPDGTLEDFIKLRLQGKEENSLGDLNNLLFTLKESLGAKWGTRTDNLSLKYFGSHIDSQEKVRISQGLTGILAPILKDIPDKNIEFCKEVKKINWHCHKVQVQYDDGSTEDCDYCVVTVSLGVLKQGKLFDPPLSGEKAAAISSLGFGTINKVFVEYKEPFWLNNEACLILAHGNTAPDDCWTSVVYKIEEVCQGKATLCLSVSGDMAIALEDIDETTIANQLTALLRQFTGIPNLPFPIGICRTTWNSDPLHHGSVSYIPVGSNLSHQCNLAIPLPGPNDPQPPRLLFAGEATSLGHFGTVEGARISGLREAERILSMTRRFGGPPRQPVAITS